MRKTTRVMGGLGILDLIELIFEVRDAEEGGYCARVPGMRFSPTLRLRKNYAPTCAKLPPSISRTAPCSRGSSNCTTSRTN